MEFLLLGGMILLMDVLRKVEAMGEGLKALLPLQIPIGIVVLAKGITLLFAGGRFVFPAVMGIISGALLLLNFIKALVPEHSENIDKIRSYFATFNVPVGIITVIAALIGMFGTF